MFNSMIRQQTISTAQIVQTINTLPARQWMLIAEQIIRNIRRKPADTAMEQAAQIACADYQIDTELTPSAAK